MIHVTVYNFSVVLQTDEQKLIDHVEQFLTRFYTIRGQGFNQSEPAADKKFVSKLTQSGVYYLHLNQFRHLLQYLAQYQYDISHTVREDKREYDSVDEGYEVREGWVLRGDQIPASDFITEDPKGSKMLSLQTGKGKAQPLDAMIKVPGGWKNMGEIVEGDMVIAKDGTKTPVLGVYPQGVTPVYRVAFSDGRSTEVSGEHLWRVRSEDTPLHGDWSVITTLDLLQRLQDADMSHFIDLCDSEHGEDVELPMEVYMFGRLVARGIEPFIPEVYLNASHTQRACLLSSIIDSTGIVQKDCRSVLYEAPSQELLEQVQYLVRSIGGIASQKKGSLDLYIYHKKIDHLFSLCHREHKDNHHYKYLKIALVEYVGEKETQCIAIEHPDKLYITDDFIVTHNTFVSLYALAKVGMRMAVVILPTFLDKWVMDIANIHKAVTTDMMVIQGSKSLKGLVQMAKEGTLSAKYFIFSVRTLQEYISDYEKDMEQSLEIYGIHPIELFPLIGVGSLLVDETHMHFHAIFKILLHTNVKLQVGLSATLISDDGVVTAAQNIVYPPKCIYDAGGLDAYTDVYALAYSVPVGLARQIKTTNYGSKNYSHTAFEVSVTRNRPALQFYQSLIDNTIQDFYIDRYEKDDKCMIFVATVKLATILAERYAGLYPEKVVRRYCESDPFDHINEGEIIVTTVISAGTAIDIPNLRVVVQTVSISSSVSNIQTLGRLRKLKDNKDTRFCYIYAENLPKQRQYHSRRIDLFRGRVASHLMYRARYSN